MKRSKNTLIFFICWVLTVGLILGLMFFPDVPLLSQIPFGLIALLVVGMWATVLLDIPRVLQEYRRRREAGKPPADDTRAN
jgi:hypothetical protein